MSVPVKPRLLSLDLVGLHAAFDPGRIVLSQSPKKDIEDGAMLIDDANLALDFLVKQLLEKVEPGVLIRAHQLMNVTGLIIYEARLDLGQFRIFSDRDIYRDHTSVDVE